MFKLIIYIFAIFCFVGCYNGYTENYIQIKDNKTKPLKKNEIKFVNTFDTSDIIKMVIRLLVIAHLEIIG